MVTIVGYSPRVNLKGNEYFALIIQGGIEFIKSKVTNSHYATAMRCYIPSSFDEQNCKALIGQKLPGSIAKKSCDPFRYADKNTGEEIEVNYRYVYLPEGATLEEVVYEGIPESATFE